MVSPSFMQMKARSLSGELSRPLLLEVPLAKGKHVKTRALSGLNLVGAYAVADRIKNCGRGAVCGNPYCTQCRKRMVSEYKGRIWQRVNGRYNGDIEAANRNFRFFTILQDWVAPDAASVRQAIEEARDELRTLRRRLGKPWLHGAWDFEMTDVERVLFGGVACSLNTDTMTRIAGSKAFILDHAISVHCHGIIDLEGRPDAVVRECLAGIWNKHSRQIDLKGFYENPLKLPEADLERDFSYNVAQISDYMFKREYRYKFTIKDNLRSKGDYLNNRYLGILANVYSSLGGRGYKNLLIWSKDGSGLESEED
jgi:hypothetical protein